MKKRRKYDLRNYIGVVFFMLMGFFCGITIVRLLGDRFSLPFLLLMLLAMYIAIFFHLIVHEAGHLVFGLATGYRFCSFRIFNLMWIAQNGSLSFRRHSLAGTGGQCLMAPPDFENGRIPVFLYNLGGSLMNLIASLLFLLPCLFLSPTSLLHTTCLIFCIVGVFTAAMNGIPLRMGMVDNDGYNAFSLRHNPEAMQAFWLQMKIAEYTTQGLRLKDMPEEWFTLPTNEAMQNSLVAAQGVYVANRLMDIGEYEKASELTSRLLRDEIGMVDMYRHLLTCDYILLELLGEMRQDLLSSLQTPGFTQFVKQMKDNPAVLRTQYALTLLWEKDAQKAEAIYHQFEKRISTYPYAGEIESELELIALVREKAGFSPSQPQVDK